MSSVKYLSTITLVDSCFLRLLWLPDIDIRQKIILYHDAIKMLDFDLRQMKTILYHDTIKMLDLDLRQVKTILYHDTIDLDLKEKITILYHDTIKMHYIHTTILYRYPKSWRRTKGQTIRCINNKFKEMLQERKEKCSRWIKC